MKGAIHWARNATREYRADFLIADSQSMDELPGGEYDMIHVEVVPGRLDNKTVVLGLSGGLTKTAAVSRHPFRA